MRSVGRIQVRRLRATFVVAVAVFSALASLSPSAALAQPDPSGIEFVPITAAGNAAYQSANPNDLVNGRGSVGYNYQIGKFEVTTAQWVEFFNAAYDRPADDRLPYLIPPDFWGAAPTTPQTPGGLRWTVPAGNEMRPVGNISWRMAAMYCNWLHNGKSAERSAFLNGAYDVGTFSYVGNIFQDQLSRSAGARYWIPTWDEWLKAAHYDPAKVNVDGTLGGWWRYSNTSDTPYTYGPPGSGTANAGFFPGNFAIPLGAYTTTTSPWGAFDMAGGTGEWTEGVRTLIGGDRYRIFEGSYWSEDASIADLVDQIRNRSGDEFPHIPTFEFGLRIATIPSPPWYSLAVVCLIISARRRRPTICSLEPSPSRY